MIQSLESGALSVRAKDLDRRIISGNTNFVRSTGRASITELIGKTDAEIPDITDNIRKENTILKQLEDNKLLLGEAPSPSDHQSRFGRNITTDGI